MKKNILLLAIFLVLTINKGLQAQTNNTVAGNIIVMLNTENALDHISEKLSHVNGIKTGLKLKSVLSQRMHIFLLEFDSTTVNPQLVLQLLKNNPLVKVAQFNHRVVERNTPNDSYFSDQWNMNNSGQNGGTSGADISACKAWDITTGGLSATGDSIVVAVIDAGFDLNHEDLSFWKNYQEIPNNSIDDDNNGYTDDFDGWNPQLLNDNLPSYNHGTHICGIIGAKGNNNKGVAGINWNIKIMPVSTDGLTEANVVAAYNYVLEQRRLYNNSNGTKGAFVVATSSSFGIDLEQPANFPLWCAMYDSLGAVGILSIAATSNNNYNVDTQGDIPSACGSNWLITVTNTNNNDTKATAGYGQNSIDLGAPGQQIKSCYTNNNYQTSSGTSMAAPHVAGTIALMYAAGCPEFMHAYKNNPDSIALIVKDSLLRNTDPIAALNNITLSGGRLNAYKAVTSIYNKYQSDSCLIPPQQISTDFLISTIYPNPASNLLKVVYQCNTGSASIRLINLFGQTAATYPVTGGENSGVQLLEIDSNVLATGVYMLYMEGEGKRTATYKIIIL